MKGWRALLALTAAAAVTAAGAFLPRAEAAWRDARGGLQAEDAAVERVQLTSQSRLSWSRQAQLVSDSNYVATLEEGEVYTGREAEQVAYDMALSLLENMGMPFDFDFSTSEATVSECHFVMDEKDPLANLLVWTVQLADAQGAVLNVMFSEQAEQSLLGIQYNAPAPLLEEDRWEEAAMAYTYWLAELNGLEVTVVRQEAYEAGKGMEFYVRYTDVATLQPVDLHLYVNPWEFSMWFDSVYPDETAKDSAG